MVLATSREGMAIDGEQLLALPPLATGEPNDDIERLLDTDAVNLFVERARQVKADFRLTSDNAAAVVEVCRRLDGVPLAIELAAARVIALSPAELARRLDRRFQVLAGGRRGAVERHATLRAAIDWSYELLSEAEQRLLARMAVFSGGCTLEAVEAICSGDPVARDAVLDLVTGLVARSLVVAEDHGSGTRYRVLETIRQYGEERLDAWGETEPRRIAHAHFYAEFSARTTENSYGPDQLMWARQANLESDNVGSALAYAIDSGNAALAVQLAANQAHQLRAEGPTGEMLPVNASPALDMPGADKEPGSPLVLILEAYKAQATGQWDVVDQLCAQALEAEQGAVASSSGHGHRIQMDTCSLQAQGSLADGAYADAVSAYARAVGYASADGYPGLAAIFLSYGVSCSLLGSVAVQDAIPRAEKSVKLARQSGMPGAIVLGLNSLALALVDRDPARARSLLIESVELACTPGEEVSSALLTASLVAGRLRDWDLALTLAARTMFLWRWSMALMASAPCLTLCARALAEDRPEVAAMLRGAAYAAYRGASPSQAPQSGTAQGDSSLNFVLAALRETGEIVATALGEERRRELREEGAAMTMDEAVSYALANIDPKLLRGPIASIDR